MTQIQENTMLAIQSFAQADGTISVWDHPNFISSVVLPDDYKPVTRIEIMMEMMNRNQLNEERMTILKVVGDAYCANENQIKRYLASKLSANKVSDHLRVLAKYGFVERHKCRLRCIEEDGEEVIRPPAPFTLGFSGYKLLKHFYSEQSFATDTTWREKSLNVQRFVAMNEIRVLGYESGNLRKWLWLPAIGNTTKFERPFAVMEVAAPNVNVEMIILRAQMAQDYIGHLKSRLEGYRYLWDKFGRIPVDQGNSKAHQIIVISASSLSMASYIHESIFLKNLPFEVWVVIDESMSETGLQTALYQPLSEPGQLERLSVSFLAKKMKETK